MSKKMMLLLTLAVAALFALPSAASAQEIHSKGVSNFFGNGTAFKLVPVGEMKFNCTGSSQSGSFDSGSTTTGKFQLHLTGCTAEFLGIKGSCNTAGAASGTIFESGTFHLITNRFSKPSVIQTLQTLTIICIGFSRVEITGNGVIGTVTSPACGASSTKMTVSFSQAGGTQEHMEYTGVKYDLSAHTENSSGETTGASGTTGLEGNYTLESSTAGTLECT
jgi:hypothetical protein